MIKGQTNLGSFKKGLLPWNKGTVFKQMLGGNNPSFKGKHVGYPALHEYIRKRLIKPSQCKCGESKKRLELSNISGEYLRELSDWEYLCHKCNLNTKRSAKGLFEILPNGGYGKRLLLSSS